MAKKITQPMPEPVFRLKLVYADGSDLVFDGGGAFERDLVRACRNAIVKRGVGIARPRSRALGGRTH